MKNDQTLNSSSVPIHIPGARLLPARAKTFAQHESGTLGLIPGGFHEIAFAAAETEKIYMKDRKGIIKHGLRGGFKLVPVYTYGERGCY